MCFQLYPLIQSNVFGDHVTDWINTAKETGKEAATAAWDAVSLLIEDKLVSSFQQFDFSVFNKYIKTAQTIDVQLDENIKSKTSSSDTKLGSSLEANIQKVESKYNIGAKATKVLKLQKSDDGALSTENKFAIIKSICNSFQFSLESITYGVENLTSVSLKNKPYTFGYAFELIHVSQYFKRTFWYTENEKKYAESIMNGISEMIYVLQELDDFLGNESWLDNYSLSSLCTTLIEELRSCRNAIAPHNSVIQEVYELTKKPVPVWFSAAQELKKF
jgi:hypothetical protein